MVAFASLAHYGYALSDRIILPERAEGDGSSLASVIQAIQDVKHAASINAFDRTPFVTFLRNPRADLYLELTTNIDSNLVTTVFLPATHLIHAIPALYRLVTDRVPVVFHVPIDAEEDTANVMAVRQTGAALFASGLWTEATTRHLAYGTAVRERIPVLHFYHVPFQSPSSYETALKSLSETAQWLRSEQENGREKDADTTPPDAQAAPAEQPAFFVPSAKTVDPIQVAESISNIFENQPDIRTHRSAAFFTYEGPSNATDIIVKLASSGSVTFSSPSSRTVGVITVHTYRPWTDAQFLNSLPSGSQIKRVAVLETAQSSANPWGPLFLDVAAAFHSEAWAGKEIPSIKEGRIHFASSISGDEIAKQLQQETNDGPFIVGSQPVVAPTNGVSTPKAPEPAIEAPYITLLNTLFPSRLNIANVDSSSSAAAQHSAQASVEYGFGQHVAFAQQRDQLVKTVERVVKKATVGEVSIDAELKDTLLAWLQHRNDAETSVTLSNQISILLSSTQKGSVNADLQVIADSLQLLAKPSRWLLGGDDLSYDIQSSGVHHLIASRENINLLLLDTQPYSEKTESAQADKRKKDVGLYAMQYGSTYVASVALNASYAHVLRALMEADKFDGPSIVLAYHPRISNVDKGLSVPLATLKETKVAVDSGYWPLYRWNPAFDKEDSPESPFKLDSERVRKEIEEFLSRENALAHVFKTTPQIAAGGLTGSVEQDVAKAVQGKIESSYASLLAGLNTQPLLILFGSDGGNAEGVAKRLGAEAKQRSLRPRILPADSFPVESLPTEQNVVFIVSTAGQGEFPGNFKETWKGLQAASSNPDFTLANTRIGVLALGDRHYWPREEDKHYFAKAGKDLDARLQTLGAQRLTELGIADDQDPDGLHTGVNAWRPLLWQALGVAELEVSAEAAATGPSDDAMKESSNFLRGTIAESLQDTSTGQMAELDTKISKFHGIYQQDDRDLRPSRVRQGLEPAFSFMVRCRIPGGVVSPEQWLAVDNIADTFANGTIKITTRQTFQFHGIIKKVLKPSIKDMNRALMDTIAACGDVNRNVLCNPNEHSSAVNAAVLLLAQDWSRHMLPQTSGYHEIWLDKKLVSSSLQADQVEPIYGKTYLPRKFKTAIAVPPHNDVDLFANDLGYIAIIENDQVVGYNVAVGGGMGMTHGNKKTYPRLASVLGFVTPEQAIPVGEAVVTVQRDYGDRTNRKHARLKYTIDDRGVEWFKAQVEERVGFKLAPTRSYKFISNGDRYGWIQESDGSWAYTLFIQNGRVSDSPDAPTKTSLKQLAQLLTTRNIGQIRLTANQHLVIAQIPSAHKSDIDAFLHTHHLHITNHSALRLNSMACVALPTCGLAMAESERYLPHLITLLESTLDNLGLRHDAVSIRMTGCPNGCARPTISEIGLVGKAPGAYNLYLGGSFSGQRLSKLYRESVGEAEIIELLTVVLSRWAKERIDGEHLGEWCIRAGIVKATVEGKDFHD
ncbi:MGSUL8 sulphite reductase [Phlyctochytrium arcticum]|nr:MGSUL8 sulphite reductase [Phlyctochytrium arcticum]